MRLESPKIRDTDKGEEGLPTQLNKLFRQVRRLRTSGRLFIVDLGHDNSHNENGSAMVERGASLPNWRPFTPSFPTCPVQSSAPFGSSRADKFHLLNRRGVLFHLLKRVRDPPKIWVGRSMDPAEHSIIG